MDGLALAVLLATANKALLDFVAAPIRRRFPDADLWWFDYVALATGAVLAWFAGANVFAGLIGDGTTGRVLTALLVGGGTALINTVLSTAQLGGLRGLAGMPDDGRRRTPGGW